MLKNFYLGILLGVSLFLIPLFVFSQEENSSFKFLSSLNEKIDRIISQLDELKNTLAQVSALATNKKLRLYTSGSGVIDFYPYGTSCGTRCRSYAAGTQVTLTAKPSKGYYFEKWGYDCASFSTNVCQLIMDRDRKVKAYFKRGSNVQYQLSVSVSGQGKVTGPGIDCGSDCTEIYSAGTSLNLSTIPNYGQQFLGWSGDCSGTGSCTLTMNSNKSVTANFTTAPSASGSLYCNSATSSSITLGYSYNNGSSVSLFRGSTLLINLGSGNRSGSYTDNGLPANTTYTYYLRNGTSSSSTLLAQATCSTSGSNQYTLTVQKSGGTGLVISDDPITDINCGSDCTGNYSPGTVVGLMAIPDPGYQFDHWSSNCTPINYYPYICTVTMDSNKTVTAYFRK